MRNSKVLVLLLVPLMCFSQKRDYIWLTGSPQLMTVIDFGNNMEIELTSSELIVNFANSAISDKDGALQFYSNGCSVANIEHVRMNDGKKLNKGFACNFFNEPSQGTGLAQSLLTLPLMGSDDQFYIFHQNLDTIQKPDFDLVVRSLHYSIVDMQEEDGLGKIIEVGNVLIEDHLWSENLSATLRSDGEGWWIVQMARYSPKFYKILFTSAGVEKVDTQYVGQEIPLAAEAAGGSVFSPDGSTYARYNPHAGTLVYDFDNSSGALSNFRQIEFPEVAFAGSVAISPNSRFLYTFAHKKVYQTDLWEEDLQEATVLVADRDTTLGDPPFIVNFYQSQLAPDCKIYVTTTFGWKYWSVVNAPDEPAPYCDFSQYSVDVESSRVGMPNFPHFRGLQDEVCDPGLVPVIYTVPLAKSYKLFPNPVRDRLQISLEEGGRSGSLFSLYDMTGQLVRMEKMNDPSLHTVSVENLTSGLYFYKISDGAEVIQEGKIVISAGGQ